MKRILQTLLIWGFSHVASTADIGTLLLDDALRMALENDERIEIGRRDVTIAGLEVDRAWTIISPRLDVSARYERPQEEIRREDQVLLPEDSLRATITARQPIFDGRVLPARRSGLALEAAETHALAHIIRATLFDVTRTYYAVLRAARQQRIAEQTVELAAEEVKRAQARYDAGEARRTELLRAEVDEARAARNLVAARSEYQVTQSDLARRLGLSPDTQLELAEPEPQPFGDTTALHALTMRALSDRDDLQAARFQIKAAEELRTVTQRESWPTLDVEYNHRFVDPETASNRNNFWDVAAVARFSAWDGGNRRISRLQQGERIQQAELRVAELEKAIQLEVQQALLDVQTARENVAALEKEVALAEESYRSLSEQARVGIATSLDVSTALIALDRARTDLTRQRFDLEVAKYQLEAATGQFAREWIEVGE